MFTLRCTSRLLVRLGEPADQLPSSPTTRLGDWYANVVRVGRSQCVLAISERTLLPALLPAAPFVSIPARLPEAVGDVLLAIGIQPELVCSEVGEMQPVGLARTQSRQLLGSMTDFARLIEGYMELKLPLLDVALRLAEAPCGPIAMRSPEDVTRDLFRQ